MHHLLSDDGTNNTLSAARRTSITMPYDKSSVNKYNKAGIKPDLLSRHNSGESSTPEHLNENDNPSYFQDQEVMELYSRVKAQKNEILSLRQQIAGASVKELQLLNEKYKLEIELADLRMAIDEKQNEIVSFASEQLASRKVHMENYLNLTHELKETEAERYTFVSSMVGLLAEYDIWLRVINASTLSNNVKHLHDQLQLKINTSHAKIGDIVSTMEIRRSANKSGNRDIPGSSLLTSSHMSPGQSEFSFHNNDINERHLQPNANMSRNVRQMSSSMPIDRMLSSSDREVAGTSPLMADRRVNMIYKERSDFSVNPPDTSDTDVNYDLEDGPGIEGFQIIGDAIPGGKLLGCGYPVRGTSLCMFQWVRHLQDGTRQYIEGATNPEYIITADDVDKVIAVECIPMDDQGRQGEIVRHFANDQNKIACDPDMEHEIDTYLSEGEAAFRVLLLMDSSENWEPATLILRRRSYQIQVNKTQDAVISEGYSIDLSIRIPSGMSTQFVLTCSDGSSYPFNANNMRTRDTIVLTMRLFQSKALDEKRKRRA